MADIAMSQVRSARSRVTNGKSTTHLQNTIEP